MTHKFKYSITVNNDHIDALKHVNNEIYIRWLMESAGAHSSACGLTLEKYLASGACFVVRRHEVDYLAPAYLGEKLIVETWIKNMHAKKSTRAYRIIREHDNTIVVTAETLWVYVDLKTARPTEIPQGVIDAFKTNIAD